ncbi:MAG TPA: carboxypeptidase-like regulatory domain-containing protein, partial [Polyangiaceae bacterium]
MKHALLVGALAAWCVSACDVATVAQVPSNVAQNQCAGDSDCAGGFCVDNQCQSRAGTLQTVLFQVTPPSDTSVSAGLQFLAKLDDLPVEGGDLPLNLDAVSQIVGEMLPSPTPPRNCKPKFDDNGSVLAMAGDNSLPGTISLTPSQNVLGLFSQAAVAQTTLANEKAPFSFSLNVPPGEYDVYYQPQHQPDDSCVVPPRLLRAQTIKSGLLPTFVLYVPEPQSFEFHVKWPHGDGLLDGWVVDMLDPVSGHVISNRASLAPSNGKKTDYVATVYYLPVEGDTSDQKAQELIRLSPPDDRAAPTVLSSRGALGLFNANLGTLSDFTTLPSKVTVHGQVTALATPKPVAATVTLVATELQGIEPGVLASFVRTVTVGDDGEFTVDLLPGKYRVSAVPSVQLDAETTSSPDSKLAAVSQSWT